MMFYSDGFDKEVEKALQSYRKVLYVDFPLMEFEGNKKQLIKTIKKCVKKKRIFFSEYAEDEDD